jgi:ABC-type transporter MlaC component
MQRSFQASFAALAFGAALASSAAFAQQAQSTGTVAVDVSGVSATIAKNISVDAAQIPATVQVPIGVAANVCGISASTLATQQSPSAAPCQAKSTTVALDQVVQKTLKAGPQAPAQKQ